MDTWTERPRSPASVSALSAPPSSSTVRESLHMDVEVRSAINDSSKDACHKASSRTKGYMRDTVSSRAKRRTIRPRARKVRDPKNSLGIPSLNNAFFASKIPHAPGVLKRTSLDSARISRTAESEFSMTDTALETLSIAEGSSPAMRCTNEAVEEWLDGCDAECGSSFPVGEVHKICLTRSESGKTWSVFTEKNLDIVVKVGQQPQITPMHGALSSTEEEEGESDAEYGLDVLRETNVASEDEIGALDGVDEAESGLDGKDSSGDDVDEPSDRKVLFGLGHIFTFLLGIGTMTVLGALK